MPDLAPYRLLAEPHLYPAGHAFGLVPEGALGEHLGGEERLATMLVLLADTLAQPWYVVDGRVTAGAANDAIGRLRRRRLPWDAVAARIALELTWPDENVDHIRVGAALDGAEAVCRTGRADVPLVDALEGLVAALDSAPVHAWGVSDLLRRARAVVRATAPPQLLDLSALGDGDAWAGPARDVARSLPPDAIAPLVRLLSDVGNRRPPMSWWREVDAALRQPACASLVEGWLREAEMVEAVPPDSRRLDAGAMLFAPGAEDVVRATVLAARLLGDDRAPARRIGNLARRAAATSGVPGMTASLSLRVAGAGVESLAARGAPTDIAVLEELLEDLTRRDLVRKVGVALSREEEADVRTSEIARAKARASARAADPDLRRERAGHARKVRSALAPVLRPIGFTAAGNTWRRRNVDRVEIVAVGLRDGAVQLEYGAWFDVAHPADEAWHVTADKVRSWDLDLRVVVDLGSVDSAVAGLAEHVRNVALPFLDRLGRWEFIRAWLAQDTGTPGGATPFARREHLGLVAAHAGDTALARELLAHYVDLLQQVSAPKGEEVVLDRERERWKRLLDGLEDSPERDR